MRPISLFLPTLLCGATALLLAPRPAEGFVLLGGELALPLRHVRVHDNFTDPESNTNTTPHRSFPGFTGPALAVWKAAAEWGSEPHGDGLGDPLQPGDVGSGGANFDFVWQGFADSIGGADDNVVSDGGPNVGIGVLAFTELPIQDGWRIRLVGSYTWHDDPAAANMPAGSANHRDIQAIVTHELGHALGLDHTPVPGATMTGSIPLDDAPLRSIEPDDIAGLQFLYGVKAPDKARLLRYTLPGPGFVELHGENFDPVANEVWFTRSGVGSIGDPVRVTGLASTAGGTRILVAIPPEAGPGDVHVKRAGQAYSDLSNGFPFDPDLTPCLAVSAFGQGKAGPFGTPAQMTTADQPTFSAGTMTLDLGGLPPNQPGLVFYGKKRTAAPFLGATLYVQPPLRRGPSFQTDFVGFASVGFPLTAGMIDDVFYLQAWYSEPSDPFGAGVTNALRVPVCP